MLSTFQRSKLIYFFHLLDLNRNGLLQFNDFSEMVEQVRLKIGLEERSMAHKRIADKGTRLFHQLLSDISPAEHQSISEEEWISYFEKRLGGKFSEMAVTTYKELIYQYIFDFFDHNRDGFITKNELKSLFEIFGADLEYLDKSFAKLDKNEDQKISRYEILAAIEDFLISDDKEAAGNWIFGNWEVEPKSINE